tara:strand:- start:3499 stop:4023 length:525 start_codon:yes stop_codon:yes gene_type:complete
MINKVGMVGVQTILNKRHKQPNLKVDYDTLVKAFSGEYRTLKDVGNELGVSKERIRQLINKFHLQDSSGRQKADTRKICPVCNFIVEKPDNIRSTNRKYHTDCKYNKTWKTQSCTVCKQDFTRRRKELFLRESKRKNTGWTKGTMFCSRKCWGKYLASYYGFNGSKFGECLHEG